MRPIMAKTFYCALRLYLESAPTADLAHILEQSSIVTLVSHYEGHPKTLIEAKARGCAVLGTKVPGIAPIILENEHNILEKCPITLTLDKFYNIYSDGKLKKY